MKDVSIVLITASNGEEASRLTRVLVKEGLVACGNIIPGVRSIYMWEGKLHDDDEVMGVFKTGNSNIGSLKGRINELHSYDCPEILVFSVDEGSSAYLNWVLKATV